MSMTPSNFSNGWQETRDKRWKKWYDAIQRDRNYSRMLLGLPLKQPIRREVRRTAERLGYRFP